ncbi:hypothetical protein AWZ03_015010, partial [Drosophila navojoa]
ADRLIKFKDIGSTPAAQLEALAIRKDWIKVLWKESEQQHDARFKAFSESAGSGEVETMERNSATATLFMNGVQPNKPGYSPPFQPGVHRPLLLPILSPRLEAVASTC